MYLQSFCFFPPLSGQMKLKKKKMAFFFKTFYVIDKKKLDVFHMKDKAYKGQSKNEIKVH